MNEPAKKYGVFVFLALIVVLSFFIIKPFIIPLVTAVILAYIFSPLYKLLLKGVRKKALAAAITLIIVLAIISVPLYLVTSKLTSEVYLVYLTSKQKLKTGSLIGGECINETSISCRIDNTFRGFFWDPKKQYYTQDFLDRSRAFALVKLSDAALLVPKMILSFFVTFFAMFYLLIDGKKIFRHLQDLLPFSQAHQKLFVRKFTDVTHATVYGTIIVALVQGSLGALGFVIFGVKAPIIWGLVMAFFAIIPFVGPGIVYIPAAVFMMLTGMSQNSNSTVVKGVLLLLWGLLIVSTIDNIIKPKIVGDRARLHPIIVLLGVLGGLALVGFVGIVIGPLILAFLLTFLQIHLRKE